MAAGVPVPSMSQRSTYLETDLYGIVLPRKDIETSMTGPIDDANSKRSTVLYTNAGARGVGSVKFQPEEDRPPK